MSAHRMGLDADNFIARSFSIAAIFGAFFNTAVAKISGPIVDADAWSRASYNPRPTIIEAARALYAHHSVEAIDQFDAGEQNLAITSRRVEELVDDARAKSLKRICFVTGVPGAGKTLVGLNPRPDAKKISQPMRSFFPETVR